MGFLDPATRSEYESNGGYVGSDFDNWFMGGRGTAALNPYLQAGEQYRGQLQNYLQGANRNPLNFDQYNQDRAQQGQLARMLQGVAGGQQAGAGELAVNRQVNQATAAQQAAASAARGSNAALAARTAARNSADLGVNGAGMAQQAAMQDQQGARGQLAGLLGQMQSGDLQQQNLGLQQYGAQNQAQQGYLAQLLGLNQNQFNNALAQQQFQKGDQGSWQGIFGTLGKYLASGVGG